MEIKPLGKNDMEAAIDLYARRMSESDYFKALFRLRRGNDSDELAAKIAMDVGPVLEKTAAYGTSLGAWESGTLAGILVCFWYKVVRQHDKTLFDMAFRDAGGKVIEESGLHGRLASLDGAILYNLALCTAPGNGYDRAAVRLLDSVKTRLRPDWVAEAVHGSDGMAKYAGLNCQAYKLDDGRILCTVRT